MDEGRLLPSVTPVEKNPSHNIEHNQKKRNFPTIPWVHCFHCTLYAEFTTVVSPVATKNKPERLLPTWPSPFCLVRVPLPGGSAANG